MYARYLCSRDALGLKAVGRPSAARNDRVSCIQAKIIIINSHLHINTITFTSLLFVRFYFFDIVILYYILNSLPLYTRYPIVTRTLGLAALRPSARACKGILFYKGCAGTFLMEHMPKSIQRVGVYFVIFKKCPWYSASDPYPNTNQNPNPNHNPNTNPNEKFDLLPYMAIHTSIHHNINCQGPF